MSPLSAGLLDLTLWAKVRASLGRAIIAKEPHSPSRCRTNVETTNVETATPAEDLLGTGVEFSAKGLWLEID